MGIDTVFRTTGILLISDADVPDAEEQLGTAYQEKQASYRKHDEVDHSDWYFQSLAADEVELIVNSDAHRGTASDFVPNLLLALKVAKDAGFSPYNQTLPYDTSWGDALSGVLRVDEDCNVTLVEVDGVSGQITRYAYSLAGVEKIKKGTFDLDSDEYKTILVPGV